MNVVRNSMPPPRGRGVRQRARRDPKAADIVPKYHYDSGFRRPLVDLVATNLSSARTPAGRPARRGTSSSSAPRSSARRGSSASGNFPNTTASSTPSAAANTGTSVIIAVTGGRGDARGEVGIAALDLERPTLILCQMSDRQTYKDTLAKILVFQPIEILMPDTICDGRVKDGKLLQSIKEEFPGVNITGISRMHFNDKIGLEYIRTLCAKEYSTVELFVKQKFYALAAAAALLKYVEYIQLVLFAPKSLKVEFQGPEDSTIIDIESTQGLGLVALQGSAPNSSLMGAIDRCSTPGGRRFLRASILQPPCNESLIKERQACVTEMVNDGTLLSAVKSTVNRLSGIDRLLTLCMQSSQNRNDTVETAEKHLNYVLLLKHTLETIPALHKALTNGEARFFGDVRKNLLDPRYPTMLMRIKEDIQNEARSVIGFTSSNMQRCFSLKAGVNDMLDIARQTYCELIDEMRNMVDQLAQRYNLPFGLGCSAVMGYHIQMELPRQKQIKTTDLPPIFIEVHKSRNCYYMTTQDLLVLSQRCKDACTELHMMSKVMLGQLLIDLRPHIGCLYQLSTDVAELDLIVSLARISSLQNYVKPTFGSRLELKNSKHPVMDITGIDFPIPNNIRASVTHNFHIVMGPNMSGKSIYLRQIVMLQIMAQIGCYVPAEKAKFRLADRIFCKICYGDSIECNASTFVLEMKETQNILQMITPRSLVIMDELCRGTTVEEGTSIAWSICEQLLHTSAFTFFTTHFLYLTKLADLYPNATNLHFEALSKVQDFDTSRLIYTHKLMTGVSSVENYGLSVARISGMPQNLVDEAQKISASLAKGLKAAENNRDDTDILYTRRCYDGFSEIYKQIENDKFTQERVLQIANQMENRLNISLDTIEDTPIQNDNPMEICATNVIQSTSSSHHWNENTAEKSGRKRIIAPATSGSLNVPRYPLEPKVLIRTPVDQKTPPSARGPAKKSETSKTSVHPSVERDDQYPHSSWRRSTTVERPRYTLDFKPLQTTPNAMEVKIVPSDQRRRESVLNRHAIVISDSDCVKGENVSRQNNINNQENIPTFNTDSVVRQKSTMGTETLEENRILSEAYIKKYHLSPTSSMSSINSTEFLKKGSDVFFTPKSGSDSEMAKISARKKEAEIFRKIEGDQFNESEFYADIQTDSDSSLEIIEERGINKNPAMANRPHDAMQCFENDKENMPSNVATPKKSIWNKYTPIFMGSLANAGQGTSSSSNDIFFS